MMVNAADRIIKVGGNKIGPNLTKEKAEKLYRPRQEKDTQPLDPQDPVTLYIPGTDPPVERAAGV